VIDTVPAGTWRARRSQTRGKKMSAMAARLQKSSARGGASRIHNCDRLWSPLPSHTGGIVPVTGRIS